MEPALSASFQLRRSNTIERNARQKWALSLVLTTWRFLGGPRLVSGCGLNTKKAGETEIDQFDVAILVEQDVLGLQVSVDY